MVRSKRWKLVEIYGSDDVEGGREAMLFDLENDPMELTNLWSGAGYSEIREKLRDQLLSWRVESGREASKTFAQRR